jgi:predicted RNase H-like HicB family nuclease
MRKAIKGKGMETLKLELSVPAKVKREGEFHVASCPVLDVHSQGKTERKAMENLKEAMTLFLETCFEMKTLDEVMKDAGLHVAGGPARRVRKSGVLSLSLSLTA